MGVSEPRFGLNQQRRGQDRRTLAHLSLNQEFASGQGDCCVPGGLFLAPHEPVPLVCLHARDLQVTSMQVMELLRMLSSHADDPGNGRPVTPDQFAGGDEAVPQGHVVNDVIDGSLRAPRVPVGPSLQFTEFSAADSASEQPSLLCTVPFAKLDVAPLGAVGGWTGRVLTDETVEWELIEHVRG